MGDMNYLWYSRELAAIAASKAEGKVYQYILGHNSALDIANSTLLQKEDIQDPYWSTHGADVTYVFGYSSAGVVSSDTIPEDMPKETVLLSEEIMSRWANFAKSGEPETDLSLIKWKPIPKHSDDASSRTAVDTPYINFTGEGGLWVESNEDKSTQCTAIIPAEPTFLGADPGSGATGVSCMLNRATVACSVVALFLFGFMLL